ELVLELGEREYHAPSVAEAPDSLPDALEQLRAAGAAEGVPVNGRRERGLELGDAAAGLGAGHCMASESAALGEMIDCREIDGCVVVVDFCAHEELGDGLGAGLGREALGPAFDFIEGGLAAAGFEDH